MSGPARWRNSFVAVSLLLLVSRQAVAQPLFEDSESIESMVLNADAVVTGRLVEFDGEGQNVLATIAVEETLKGTHEPQRRLSLSRPVDVLRKWEDRKSLLLVAARAASSGSLAIDLESENLAVLTASFKVLRKANVVIEVARQAGRRTPGVTRIQTFRLAVPREAVAETEWEACYATGGYLTLRVPVDEQLEKRAQGYIRSASYEQRREGALALRYCKFKSHANIAQLKTLLDDPAWAYLQRAEANKGREVRIYGVRQAAYETLKHWGVDVAKPTIREEILRLDPCGQFKADVNQ